MKDGPNISRIAALIGDPARSNILVALMDGRALTVTELAQAAGVTIQTASGHLAKLGDAGLTATEKQGRHRYVRLSGADVAQVLEMLMGLAQRTGAVRVRTGPRDVALRSARMCYDHLAGERGVALLDMLRHHNLIDGFDVLSITASGREFFSGFGIDMVAVEASRRPACRACLDWSERRYHLGGALGAAMFNAFIERKWAIKRTGRVIEFSQLGVIGFADMLLA
ncbi:MAG: helix-turn-helix transcriptional regulator [Chakrabartia sp.]